jgi:hypothetical protein
MIVSHFALNFRPGGSGFPRAITHHQKQILEESLGGAANLCGFRKVRWMTLVVDCLFGANHYPTASGECFADSRFVCNR